MADELYISESAWTEFQRQDVFGTMDEFMEAMPPATRAVHLLPGEVASQVEGYRPVSACVAGDELLFTSPRTQTFTHPGWEEPNGDDESIWRVDHAKDLAKEQGMRDETEIGQKPYHDPYDNYVDVRRPVEHDEYERDINMNPAVLRAALNPISLTVPVSTGKVAMRWDGIVDGLRPSIIDAARNCNVSMKRASPKTGRWTFNVQSSGSDDVHTVHLKAARPKGSSALYMPKLDLKIGCSCNFWKWQGPDYHASKHGYLDRKPRSNGSAPSKRDPEGMNRVCKHVYAASALFLRYYLPKAKRSNVQAMDRVRNKQAYAGAELVKADGPARRLKALGLKLEALTENRDLVSDLFEVAERITHTG